MCDSYINIRKILPGNTVEEIYIYEFDQLNTLRNSVYAKTRQLIATGNWRLEDIKQTVFTAGKAGGEQTLTAYEYERANWDSLLDPEIINLLIIRPRYLSVWGLYHYIQFLQLNSQSNAFV